MNEKPSDDLTAIKGIGPVWQRRLQESLGVRTFRDLAALSCDEILSRLEASGQIAPSKADCEAWINQAQELAAATGSSTKRSEWKPFASFVVEYLGRITEGKTDQRRTKVHHLETDTDANWPGIVSVELCRWMLEQTDEIAPSEVEKLIEAYRAQAQSELEQELKGQRAAAQQQLQQALKEEQTSARQVLQQELDDQRAQAQKEQEQASKQAQETLQQELDKARNQSEQDLQQQIQEQRDQAQQALQQDLEETRNQAEQDLQRQLQEQGAQAQQALQQKLVKMRSQAEQELQQQLQEQRDQAQQALQEELDETRNQAEQELQQQLQEQRDQAQKALQEELDETRNLAEQELQQQLREQREQAQQALPQQLDKAQNQVEQDLQEQQLQEQRVEAQQETQQEQPVDEESQLQPEPEPGKEEVQPSATRPLDEPRITLANAELQAYQPAEVTEPVGVGFPDQPFSGFINSDEMFKFALDLVLAEPAGPELVEQGTTFYVQFYARNILSGSKEYLGETKASTFVEGQSSYIASLANITLGSGIYELSTVFMTLQDGHPVVHYMMMVPLQVL